MSTEKRELYYVTEHAVEQYLERFGAETTNIIAEIRRKYEESIPVGLPDKVPPTGRLHVPSGAIFLTGDRYGHTNIITVLYSDQERVTSPEHSGVQIR